LHLLYEEMTCKHITLH